MKELQKLIDWILERIDPQDRELVSYRTEEVALYAGPDVPTFRYTALVFEIKDLDSGEVTEKWTSADSLLMFPRNAMWFLAELGIDHGLKVDFNYDSPVDPVPEVVNPVGAEWPQQGEGAYLTASPDVKAGDVWTDERGLFVCVRKFGLFGTPYYVWTKQEVSG